ncbi:hypothetical protein [Streptomyces albus]|uniref:hypothetical protein n=1 Tax=Streptomyces albus TaxID=1888 RepID=UPI0024E0C05A|nr:hypothetical protein [Streptomyces albus]GHJ21522.1 hypothetical protein TPA0909_31360 [Streptomyces albus]
MAVTTGRRPVGGVQFQQDAADQAFHPVLRDAQPAGYLLVAEPGDQLVEHLVFAGGEPHGAGRQPVRGLAGVAQELPSEPQRHGHLVRGELP